MQKMLIPPVIAPQQLAELIHDVPRARLIDVRTPGEYLSGHISGAYNVPLDQLAEHASEIAALDAPVVLVCRSGQRARTAEEALRTAGSDRLHVLAGGMQAWEAAGLPVRRAVERISLERQVRIAAGSLAAIGALLSLLTSPAFALVPLLVGGGLAFSGLTDTCGMAMVLARLPYNRPVQCDVKAMVRALSAGTGLENR